MKRFPAVFIVIAASLASCVPSPPTFSPDSRLVAFATPSDLAHDIWVLDVETSEPLIRLRTEWIALSPRFSPDGSGIAYLTVPSLDEGAERMRLWVLDPISRETRRITEVDIDDRAFFSLYPEWLPDASGIVIPRTRPGRGWDIALWDRARDETRDLVSGRGDEILPRISPDGSRLAYIASSDTPGVFDLRVTDLFSSGNMTVSDASSDRLLVPSILRFSPAPEDLPTFFEFGLAFSNDGREIAFERAEVVDDTGGPRRSVSNIWAVDIETGERRLLAERPEPSGGVTWSSLGIAAFTSGNTEMTDIYIGDGGIERRAYPASLRVPGKAFFPVWSPDGRYLAFRDGNTPFGTVRIYEAETGADTWYPVNSEEAIFSAYQARREGPTPIERDYLSRALAFSLLEAAAEAESGGDEEAAHELYLEAAEISGEGLLGRIASDGAKETER